MKTYYVAGLPFSDELYHHGIKGQKWGVRRFQNLDRTWTEEGKKRYAKGLVSTYQKIDGSLTPAGKELQDKHNKKYNYFRTSEDIDREMSDFEKLIGTEQFNKLDDEWTDVLWQEYYMNTDVLSKEEREAIDNTNRKREEQHDRLASEQKKMRTSPNLDNEFNKLTGRTRELYDNFIKDHEYMIKEDPSRKDDHEYSIRGLKAEAVVRYGEKYKKMRSSYEKTLDRESDLYNEMFGRYKSRELQKIISRYPKELQNEIYSYIRFSWWRYD